MAPKRRPPKGRTAPREVAVDLEDDENEYHESVNSLYKPADDPIQEEDPLLEEPAQNRPTLYKPKDHFNGTYIVFFLLGTGSLLPLNFIMTAKHYWMYKLQNCSEELSPAEQRPPDIRGPKALCRFNKLMWEYMQGLMY